MTAARRLAFVAVFVSAAWTTVPRLAGFVRSAVELWGLSATERRKEMFGAFYESILRIDAAVPRDEPLAIVADAPDDINAGLFVNYYLYPRRTRLFPGLIAYRIDPRPPERIVRIDLRRSAEARLMSYPGVRAEGIAGAPVVRQFDLPTEAGRSFVVPLVSSGDGPVPDVYTTEAAMENAGPAPAAIRVEMFPHGHSAGIVLQRGERRTWTDFVYEVFGTMDAGWLRVDSDQPLRARFWFVSRSRSDADPLRFVRWFRRATLDVPPGGRLWVLNPHDQELPVRLNEGQHRLPPRSVIPLVWVGEARLESSQEWYAFVSWRDAGGGTTLIWPEDR